METQPVLQNRQSGRDFQSPNEASVSALLDSFFEGVARDPRISWGHIGIYAAFAMLGRPAVPAAADRFLSSDDRPCQSQQPEYLFQIRQAAQRVWLYPL